LRTHQPEAAAIHLPSSANKTNLDPTLRISGPELSRCGWHSKGSLMKQKIRQSGNAWGAREAKLAIASLGNLITHDQAVAWVNGVIDYRSGELRVAGASVEDIEAWDRACRIMFMLKVRPLIIKRRYPHGFRSSSV
jgi:hypothetical protein